MLRRNHSLRSDEIAWCTRLLRGDHLPNDRNRALKELRAADWALLLSQGALCLSSLLYTLPESSRLESPEYAMVGAMMLLLGLCGVVGVLRGSCALLHLTHLFCAMTALFACVMLLALPSVRDHCAKMVTRQRTCLRCTPLEVRACPMLATHHGLVLAQQRRSNGQRQSRLPLAATGGHLPWLCATVEGAGPRNFSAANYSDPRLNFGFGARIFASGRARPGGRSDLTAEQRRKPGGGGNKAGRPCKCLEAARRGGNPCLCSTDAWDEAQWGYCSDGRLDARDFHMLTLLVLNLIGTKAARSMQVSEVRAFDARIRRLRAEEDGSEAGALSPARAGQPGDDVDAAAAAGGGDDGTLGVLSNALLGTRSGSSYEHDSADADADADADVFGAPDEADQVELAYLRALGPRA